MRAAFAQVGFQGRGGLPPQRHQALLVPLAHAAEVARLQLQVRDSQAHQLGDTQPGGVEHLEHSLVAQPLRVDGLRGRQQALDLLHAQELGQPLPQAWRVDVLGGVVPNRLLLSQEAEETAHRRQRPRHRAAVQPLLVEASQEIHHVLPGHPRHRQLARPAKLLELLQVAPVGGHRVPRQPPLHPDVVQEGCDLTPHDYVFWLGAEGTTACMPGICSLIRRPVTRV